jgi:ubiquinone/menaquinone biosynthesis C-methylase UbiE
MTWHETIEYIRKQPEFSELVKLAYFDENLELNVERFGASEEFRETLKMIRDYSPLAKTILEIGAGNGIAAINFALAGYEVTVVEPDDSTTVGAQAIQRLVERYQLKNVTVHQNYAEEIGFEDEAFDIVYIRQAMHHAYDLQKFVAESARVIKKGGFLMTIRDHVILDEKDKKWFLEMHPLHKFYGGENAFTAEEYKNAMRAAGLSILKELKFYDSIINYFPIDISGRQLNSLEYDRQMKQALRKKISILAELPFVLDLYKLKNAGKMQEVEDENRIAGRMYSYIATKR